MADSLWSNPEYQSEHTPDAEDVETSDVPQETDKEPYIGFGTAAKDPTRIRIINEFGIVSQPRYVFMDDQIMIHDEWLALVFTHYALILHGKNLDGLLNPLQEEKVSWIQCFQTDRHLLPANKDEVVIISISRYTHVRFQPLLEEMEEKMGANRE